MSLFPRPNCRAIRWKGWDSARSAACRVPTARAPVPRSATAAGAASPRPNAASTPGRFPPPPTHNQRRRHDADDASPTCARRCRSDSPLLPCANPGERRGGRMEYFVQQLINGITLGSIYGLIAIGYTMVFGIIGMVNFAHGDVFM